MISATYSPIVREKTIYVFMYKCIYIYTYTIMYVIYIVHTQRKIKQKQAWELRSYNFPRCLNLFQNKKLIEKYKVRDLSKKKKKKKNFGSTFQTLFFLKGKNL